MQTLPVLLRKTASQRELITELLNEFRLTERKIKNKSPISSQNKLFRTAFTLEALNYYKAVTQSLKPPSKVFFTRTGVEEIGGPFN